MMRVICFGDSNTYGYDPRSWCGGRYPAEDRWTDRLGIVNAGENGSAIPADAHGLRLAAEDLLLVMLGTNDLLQGATAAETAARMEQFLTGLLPRHSRILLIAPPPMKRGAWVPSDELVEESTRLAEAYRTLAQRLGIPFADTRDWGIELCFDGVHFTEAGHHRFAEKLSLTLPLRDSL